MIPSTFLATARGLVLVLLLAAGHAAMAGSWTALTNSPPDSIGPMLLLPDGTVIAAQAGGNAWYRLTPTSTGSYINGTWTTLASMHDTRLYYSSDVLQNGSVFVAGGEYGTGGSKAEIYNPQTNTWTAAPSSGEDFVDSISTTLPNGNVLVAPVYPTTSGGTIIYNVASNTWTAGPTLYRGGDADEQSWVKLQDGSILTIDGDSTSERYIPALNEWLNDGTVPDILWDGLGEIGAGTLLANGKVLYLGASGHTAIYTPSGTTSPGAWVAGPDIPGGLGTDDAPIANMINGHVLCEAGPSGTYNGPSTFFDYNPTANTITQINGPTGSTLNAPPFVGAMLNLPDGTVLMANQGSQLYVYTPTGTTVAAGTPAISNISHNSDGSYTLTGTLLNGISEGAAYGDDNQMATNYPIVRLTSGNNVYYARTYNWSSTGVMTGTAAETTNFVLPLGLPAGTYAAAVIANGNASATVSLTTPSGTDTAPTVATGAAASPATLTGTQTSLTVLGASGGGESNLTYTWTTTSAPYGASTPSFSINGTNAAKNTTAIFASAGTYTFTVTITDVAGLSVTNSVNVTVNQTLASILIAPALTNLTAGQAQQFSATGCDQFNIAMNTQPGFTWALASGSGSVSSSGLYTSPASGTQAIVTASSGSVVGSGTADVVDAPWISVDVGSPAILGSAYDIGGTFTVMGAGSDIWDPSDQFHYVCRPLTGNGIMIARVATQQNTDPWAKAGILISDGLADNTDHAFMCITPGNGANFQYRSTAGGSSNYSQAAGPTAPYWVKLVRNGNTFTGYYSATGTTWTQAGSASITMGSTVYIGLAVCAHNASLLNTSTFDHVSAFIIANGSLAVNPGVSGSLNVLANDSALNGSTLTVTSVTQGTRGSVVNNGNGVVTYTPNPGAIGMDTFNYTVSDGIGDTGTASVTVTINGLRAYYKCEETSGTTTADATGDGYTASLIGTTWTTGVEATGGLGFAGTSASYGTIPALNLNSNTVTMTAWIYCNGAQSSNTGLVYSRAGSTVAGLNFSSSNVLGYNWNDNPSTYDYYSGLTVPAGQWTFTALVITSSNAKLYMQPVGGSLSSATSSVANSAAVFDGVTSLGVDPNEGTRYFNGSMDEIRIYNTALTGTAIAALAIATPTVATSATASPGTVTGTSTALSVLGTSNIVSESTLSYTWSATTLPSGAVTPIFSANGTNAAKSCTATFSHAGNYTLMATITDKAGGSITSSVNVTVSQVLTSVSLAANAPSIGTQITQQFTATADDQFGNPLASQPTFTWSNTGYGSVGSTGLYSAPYASGNASISASTGAIISTGASVTASTPWKTWLISKFTTSQVSNPAITGALVNPAGDNVTNLMKYALGMNPKVDSVTGLPVLSSTSGKLKMQFTRNTSATDVTYTVAASPDMVAWTTIASLPAGSNTWSQPGATVTDNAGAVTVVDGTAINQQSKRFLELTVALP